jgi:hypothetical protein
MTTRPTLRVALIALIACATSACELVADFDRDKIPDPPRDAATFDASTGNPTADAATDGSVPPEEDAGDDDDAGR